MRKLALIALLFSSFFTAACTEDPDAAIDEAEAADLMIDEDTGTARTRDLHPAAENPGGDRLSPDPGGTITTRELEPGAENPGGDRLDPHTGGIRPRVLEPGAENPGGDRVGAGGGATTVGTEPGTGVAECPTVGDELRADEPALAIASDELGGRARARRQLLRDAHLVK